ncbi:MAG: precorrin-6y C5,15-methyltransferase (decarboxylating) subunit CbiE [Clostridia bacterium]|nr:precorrin-6y C5,15-methyltransferase (decarboxylating) subunit CbiE [Clostridia bacterium]
MKVILLGLGGGSVEMLTRQAINALKRSDMIIGAKRLINSIPKDFTPLRFCANTANEIMTHLQNGKSDNAAVVFSGDSGFYSGAKSLLPLLEQSGIESDILPGISSVQLLASRLKRPWQDWKLVSAHGVECDAVSEIMCGKPVFFLTGGKHDPSEICRQLVGAGLGDLTAVVGENLSCPDEKITAGSAEALSGRVFSKLSVLLTEKAPLAPKRSSGWQDECFIRGDVPMTKQLVRAAIISKLCVSPENTCWDIGAGTGSVSVELAAVSRRVFAVECSENACDLIRKNRAKHMAWNLSLTQGNAPDALIGLPEPDVVFIGGSGGRLKDIIDYSLAKNPLARICVSAIALETLNTAVKAFSSHGMETDITQIAVNRTKSAGNLHMLTASNPIFLITGNAI